MPLVEIILFFSAVLSLCCNECWHRGFVEVCNSQLVLKVPDVPAVLIHGSSVD